MGKDKLPGLTDPHLLVITKKVRKTESVAILGQKATNIKENGKTT